MQLKNSTQLERRHSDMGLQWTVVALCALQALAVLAVLPTEQLSRNQSNGESLKSLQGDTLKSVKITDDSITGQLAALKERLEEEAECWGQRRRRRRRRRRPRPTQQPDGNDGDGNDGDSNDGGDDVEVQANVNLNLGRRRRREAQSPQRQFLGSGNTPASVQGSMRFGHSSSTGTDIIGQNIPDVIGQGINAAKEILGGGGKAGSGGLNLGTAIGGTGNSGVSVPGGLGGNSRLPGMGSQGANIAGSGRPWTGSMGGSPMQDQGSSFLGKIPGMAAQMLGGSGSNGGLNVGSAGTGTGGSSSWSLGGHSRLPSMESQNGGNMGGPGRQEMGGAGSSPMQSQGSSFLGKIPGMAAQIFGGSGSNGGLNVGSAGTGTGGSSSWSLGGQSRLPSMESQNGGNMGGPGRQEMGGAGSSPMQSQGSSFLGKIPGMAAQMFGRNGGNGGVNSWSSTGTGMGGHNRLPGMGGQNGPNMGGPGRQEMMGEGSVHMQGQGSNVLGKIPGMTSQMFGRNVGNEGSNSWGSSRPGMSGGGGFPEMGVRREPNMEGESGGGRPSMSFSGRNEGMGYGHRGSGMGGEQGGRGMGGRQGDPNETSHMHGYGSGRGNYQGETSVNFSGSMGSRETDSRPIGGRHFGQGEDMIPRGTMPPENMGRPSRGDMVSRGITMPANKGGPSRGDRAMTPRKTMPPGNMEVYERGRETSSRNVGGNAGGSLHSDGRMDRKTAGNIQSSNGPSGQLNGRSTFGATRRTESRGRTDGRPPDQRREGRNGRSKRQVTNWLSTSMNGNRQRMINRSGATGGSKTRTSISKSRNRSSRRGIARGQIDNDGLSTSSSSSSSSSSSATNRNGRAKGTFSFSSITRSSNGRGMSQSGGGVIGSPPSVQTVRNTRAKRQVDIGGAVAGAALAAQAALAIAGQLLGLAREGIVVAGLAANTTIDVVERLESVRPQPSKRRIVVRIYQPRRRG